MSFQSGTGLRTVQGNLEEIAEKRAVVLADVQIPDRTSVSIRAMSVKLTGIVLGATYNLTLGYYHEIELADESLWDENQFRPSHMLKVPSGPGNTE